MPVVSICHNNIISNSPCPRALCKKKDYLLGVLRYKNQIKDKQYIVFIYEEI